MKLRLRLALTMVVIAVPLVVGLALYALHARRNAMLESVYDTTVERLDASGRDLCVERPRRFEGRRPRARRGRPARREAYDASFRPQGASAPIAPALRAALESGEEVAAEWGERRVRIAMRMPWEGPCAVVVVTRPLDAGFGRGGFLRALAYSGVVALLVVLAALIALGPVVRRIRRLTRSVRSQKQDGYASDVEVRGKDEIAELARAFNEASAEIRARLTEVSDRDRALTEFLSSTTHDVMIPLTVLSGHLSDLSDSVEEGGAVDGAKVRGALEEAHYLTSLIRNLSAAARLDAGEPMLRRHAFDLREVVERVVARHRPIARPASVSLDYAVPEGPLSVKADSTLVEQALGNLVSNAIKYNDEGGHVAVILERRGGGFSLRVLDDGPGIPEDELARVEERRFRGGAARQRQPTGLGLGLHIVRDVADKHGWRLTFESPEAGGLSVSLEWKQEAPDQPAQT
ncbi:MAG: ATP-binding protein [Sandaracinaceae bacterium]